MSSAFVSATVDLGDVEKGFAAMERRAKILRPAWLELRRPMRADQSDHAKKQAGPEGKWPKRAAATEGRGRAQRRRHRTKVKAGTAKAKPKFRSRKLLGSLPNRTVKVQPLGSYGLIAFSKVPWSGVQQEGGRVGRGSIIPARPFLWLSGGFLKKVEDTVIRHVTEAF